jgi:hypothetical protein
MRRFMSAGVTAMTNQLGTSLAELRLSTQNVVIVLNKTQPSATTTINHSTSRIVKRNMMLLCD